MKKLHRVAQWLLRTWFVSIPILLVISHVYIGIEHTVVIVKYNKLISLVLQLVGGLFVLYSIDSNLDIIKRTSLWSMFVNWLKEFPLIKKSVTLEASPATAVCTGLQGKIRVSTRPTTLEEVIDHFNKEIAYIRGEMNEENQELQTRISNVQKSANEMNKQIHGKLHTLKSKVEDVTIGGFKAQVMGVLFVVHGSVAGYIA